MPDSHRQGFLIKEDGFYAVCMLMVLVISVIAYGWSALYWALPIVVIVGFGLRFWRRRNKKGS